jgi:RNA polymerase sigma-70 factor (ECF subfamily)
MLYYPEMAGHVHRPHPTMPATSRSERPQDRPKDKEVADALAAFQRGIDREGNFALLVERYYEPVFRYLSRWNLSDDDRLDITQDVFLRVYKGLPNFRGESQFSTWIFSIAHNSCTSWRDRTRQIRAVGSLDNKSGDEPGDSVVLARATSLLEDQLDYLIARESAALLRQAIADLPAQMRRCVQLQIYQDLQLSEIAAVLRLSTGAVKAHLFQAREKLRARLRGPVAGERPL